MCGYYGVELTEAIAAEFGAQLAAQLGYRKLIIEVDSLTLVEKFAKAAEVDNEVGLICINLSKYLRDTGSENDRISHVKRMANNSAHIMAHSKTNWESREVWIDRPPIFLVDQLVLDNVTPILP
ncbi:unnamed protein product [Linum tenue]|uniref:RNase H type-1 domain-containing protein n=1 Tax=Linum tenue TaxID=586396 RepID=A0AAV0IA58_9ROSI|nr:unnamed protein product [Linum tenue]